MLNSINADEKKDANTSDFLPETPGVFDRWGYTQNIERGAGDAVTQTLGRKDILPPSNPNDYVYSRTIEFPQPSIAGVGSVLSGGGKDTNRFFFSQNWTTSKTGTGTYLITHNIGDNKYNVLISPLASSAFSANISAYNINSFQVSTFNASGVAADCPFTFTLWIIP